MTIIWTLNCFFMLYTWPTKQVFCLYLRRILDNKSFWMSLKLTFLALKKSGTSCPKWGGGTGEFGQNPEKQQLFFVKPSLSHPLKSLNFDDFFHIKGGVSYFVSLVSILSFWLPSCSVSKHCQDFQESLCWISQLAFARP